MNKALVAFALALGAAAVSRATIVITEVDPTGSSTSTYKADWFELTNTGTSAQDITGWKMDDNSDSFGSAAPLDTVTSIGAGQSVVFIEDTGVANESNLFQAFETAWFGSNVPAGFTMGGYGGSGVGLGSSGDHVNIFDSSGNLMAGAAFGATSQGVTLDNSAGITTTSLPDPTISTNSQAGVNGAFTSPNSEVGSPGVVPEPAALGLLAAAGLLVGRRRGK